MAGTAGFNSRAYLGGYRISPYINNIEFSKSFETAEVSTFEGQAKKYIATKSDATGTIGGWWEEALDSHMLGLFDGTENVLSFYPAGSAAGSIGKSANVIETEIGTTSDQGGAVEISGSFQCTGAAVNTLSIIPETSYAVTTNTASLDNTVATTNGGYGVLHVTAVTGTVPVVIEDSADNVSFATICTFTSVTAAGAQMKAITGNIRRYVRAKCTISGATITMQVSINRG